MGWRRIDSPPRRIITHYPTYSPVMENRSGHRRGDPTPSEKRPKEKCFSLWEVTNAGKLKIDISRGVSRIALAISPSRALGGILYDFYGALTECADQDRYGCGKTASDHMEDRSKAFVMGDRLDFLTHGMNPKTRGQYKRGWRRWKKFAHAKNKSPMLDPIEDAWAIEGSNIRRAGHARYMRQGRFPQCDVAIQATDQFDASRISRAAGESPHDRSGKLRIGEFETCESRWVI